MNQIDYQNTKNNFFLSIHEKRSKYTKKLYQAKIVQKNHYHQTIRTTDQNRQSTTSFKEDLQIEENPSSDKTQNRYSRSFLSRISNYKNNDSQSDANRSNYSHYNSNHRTQTEKDSKS